MRKGGPRPRSKKVHAASKETRCGVPCTLRLAAWTIFILLLFTLSISHQDGKLAQRGYFYTEIYWPALFWSSQASSSLHAFGPEVSHLQGRHYRVTEWVDNRSGEYMERRKADKLIFPGFAVLEESDDFARPELTGASLDGRGDRPDDAVEGSINSVYSSSDEKSVPAPENSGELHLSHSPTSMDKLEAELSSGVVSPTRIVFKGLGEPIDALQYAEYGAGLLQRSGHVEDNPRICLIRDAGKINCRVTRHHRELSGQNCIWLPQICAEGRDQAFRKDALAEEERCHDASIYERDLVADIGPEGGSYVVCQTDSLSERMAVCGFSCSTESECYLPGAGPDSGFCNDRSSSDLSLCLEGHRQVETAASDAQESRLSEPPNYVELPVQHEDEEASSPDDIDEDEKAEVPQDTVNVQIVDDESKVVGDASVEQMVTSLEFLSALVNSEATGRESLIDPADDGLWEDFDDELLVPLSVKPESSLEEPRRLQRVGSVMSLDEYKRTIMESQRKSGNQVNLSSMQAQRVRHSDETYNYASASHGAKLLASNKEAKGASHILTSDKDKYLRNPCGAEEKYVVLELSEETFVDTVVISNFEFHSSNLKDFEVFGSTVYPSKDWISLGKFQAENVRHRQKFTIEDPKMVRHLMIKMLTHWGSEFFCTLSIVEVFGVDVIKNLLEDWIALEEVDNNARTQGSNGLVVSQDELALLGGSGHQSDSDGAIDAPFTETLAAQTDTSTGPEQGGVTPGRDTLRTADGLYGDEESKAGSSGDSSGQDLIHLGGKPPGDSVLKILMQRVKALELNQTLFDLYLGDMIQKYKVMLSELDRDLALVTERLQNETALTASLALRLADRDLQRKEEKQYMENRFASIANNFTDSLDMMRWQIQSMERREITAILLCLFSMILSALLHLLASCLPKRNPTREIPARTTSLMVKEGVVDSTSEEMNHKLDNLTLSKVCRGSSSLILYLACALIILVLSV